MNTIRFVFAVVASLLVQVPADRSPTASAFSPTFSADLSRSFAEVNGGVETSTQSFTFDIPRKVKIVMWSKFLMRNSAWMQANAPNCELQRAFERDVGVGNVRVDPDYDISDADVVVFNLAPLEQNYVLPTKKYPGQLWVAGCWEPEHFDGGDIVGDCSLMSDETTMRQMDGVASYDNSSAFPAFFTPPTEEQMRRPAPDFALETRELATYSVSDCRTPFRNDWALDMNRSLVEKGAAGLLSFGKCFHSATEEACAGPEAVQEPPATGAVQEWTFVKYANRCAARPFALVAENSMSPWYVTEKVWNALATGAVPVYFGPPEVKLMVPAGSIIYAPDYDSTDALVEAMLSYDAEAHRRARLFKTRPTSEWGMWSRARAMSRATLLPRLCAAVARLPQRQVAETATAPPLSAASPLSADWPALPMMFLAQPSGVAPPPPEPEAPDSKAGGAGSSEKTLGQPVGPLVSGSTAYEPVSFLGRFQADAVVAAVAVRQHEP